MPILGKIEEISKFLQDNKDNDQGKDRARELKDLAGEAIRNGMKSRAWQTYMEEFASDPKELKRLIGEDEDFNKTQWGLDSLAYIPANSTCDIQTTTRTSANMSPEMKANLDHFPTDEA
jgi:hypothetical protein